MAENEQDYSSSTSKDYVDSMQSLEEEEESVPDQIAQTMAEDLTRKTKEMKMGLLPQF